MKIDVELVKQLIDEQFPKWSNLEIKPIQTMGHDNRTFHLGNDMLVRLPSGEDYAYQPVKEQRWLPFFAKKLAIKVPTIVGYGKPNATYPFQWSIISWIDGEQASANSIKDRSKFAVELAAFLNNFHALDASDGPAGGVQNFYRGGDLSVYDVETKMLIEKYSDVFNQEHLTSIWNEALSSKWTQEPVWVHGDLFPTNILVKDGMLEAIIDFGVLGIGDPACDLVMYWSFFDEKNREVFKEKVDIDEETWQRTKGWFMWKALLMYQEKEMTDTSRADEIRRTIEQLYI